jgi:hypothetical protein
VLTGKLGDTTSTIGPLDTVATGAKFLFGS